MRARCVSFSRRTLLRDLLDLEEQTLREREQVKKAMASIAAQFAEANKAVTLALAIVINSGMADW